MKIGSARARKTIPSGTCKLLTSAGMLAVLTGPVIIHAILRQKPEITQIISVKEIEGPLFAESDADGSRTTNLMARSIHGGDQLAWVLRLCSSLGIDLDVERELVETSSSGSSVVWGPQFTTYRFGECRNLIIRASIPVGSPPGRYEMRPALKAVLRSGRTLVEELPSLPFVVGADPLD